MLANYDVGDSYDSVEENMGGYAAAWKKKVVWRMEIKFCTPRACVGLGISRQFPSSLRFLTGARAIESIGEDALQGVSIAAGTLGMFRQAKIGFSMFCKLLLTQHRALS